MEPLGLRQLSVWVDEAAPERGGFAHALDWAACLGLPLRGIAPPLHGWCGRLAYLGRDGRPNGQDGPFTASAEQLDTCERACRARGVAWLAAPWQGPWTLEVEQSMRPGGLCVIGDALPTRLKDELLRQSLQRTQTSVLVCPRSWRPVSRVLVLHQHGSGSDGFLASAAGLCRALGVQPVVLTVARSEGEARARQRSAEEVFAAQRWAADFDFVVGCDLRTAVAWAVRWRHSAHVVLERRNAPSWWRRLRGDTLGRLLGLSDSLTFLALSGAGSPLLSPAEAGPARRPGGSALPGPTAGRPADALETRRIHGPDLMR